MASKKGRSRLRRAQAVVGERVAQIDDDIKDLEKLLRPYEKIKEEIDKLRSARRALLGGSRMTGAGSSKTRQEDVVEFLETHPGSSATEIADALGTNQSAISSHLYRGRDDRFITKDKKWWVRDPKNGLDSADDIDD